MEYARLFVALVIPWLGGVFWLQAVEARTNYTVTPNFFRQLAYGFFLGYAGLHGIILASAAIFEQVQFWPVAATLLVISVIGAIKARHRTISPALRPSTSGGWSTLPLASRVILALLLLWIAIHLTLAAVELLYRPTFPWDAWLNWMYRAKAWFFQGTLVPFSSPAEWATSPTGPAYNVAGNNYPTFVPTIALWVASALGFWSETLVNLPVLLCGIALAMGVYGQCREAGGSCLESTVPAYLLLSIPIVGTHLALGGMADIWMAGFTGLGLVALLRGLIDNHRFQCILGLLMAALAITTKVEGLVWFLAAIATMLLMARPGLAIAAATLLALLALVAWLAGVTYIVLPGGELLGYVDGLVHIPFKGSYPLMRFDVADDYFLNFFARGSWHILWSLLLLSLPLLFIVKLPRMAAAFGCFYLIFFATQLIIFGFTEQGRWAEDSTAINRLPLHFVPALVFCLMLPAIRLRNQNAGTQAAKSVGRPGAIALPLAAVALIAAVLVSYLAITLPPEQGKPRVFTPEDLAIVAGAGRIENGTGVINTFQNGIAIVSSGRTDLAASTLTLLRVDTGPGQGNEARFFWRRQADPGNVESVPLALAGTELIDLSAVDTWQGNITELGLVFYKHAEDFAEFRQIALLPKTVESSLRSLWDQWTQPEPWSQASANWIEGGGRTPVVSLPLLVLAWLLLMLGMSRLFVGTPRAHFSLLVAYSLLAWIALDIRWTTNLIIQAADTVSSSPPANGISYIDTGKDQRVAAFVQTAREHIPESFANILIYADRKEMSFQALRAKYHLLPHAAYVHTGDIASIPNAPVNYVLAINSISLEPRRLESDRLTRTRLLRQKFGANLAVELEDDFATLYKIGISD